MLVDDLAGDAGQSSASPMFPFVDGDPARICGGHLGAELLGWLVMPPVPRGDVRAVLGEAVADGGSDAAGSSGDQGHLSRKRVRPA